METPTTNYRFLKDMHDVSVAELVNILKQGAALHDHNGFKVDTGGEYFELNDCGLDLNSAFVVFKTDETLTLEVGECYKTRNGAKAFISNISEYGCEGAVANSTEYIDWDKNGRVWEDCESDEDIVAKWKQ